MENRIRELRKKYHMSQIHLSIELEVSQETVSAYEKGKYYPSFQTLLRLSKIFNASIDYIMGLSDEMGQNPHLSDSEYVLLNHYSRLNENQKEKALAYMQGLYDSQN
ncbi:MAG: helix-turn-helix transcriptional regulator [Clostridia bacterium]|nr:helix-turn-helix transcriptional regulator [Clostridia bacterium]